MQKGPEHIHGGFLNRPHVSDQGTQCPCQLEPGPQPLCVEGRGAVLAQAVGMGHRNRSPSHESVGFWKAGACELLSLRGRHRAAVASEIKGLWWSD